MVSFEKIKVWFGARLLILLASLFMFAERSRAADGEALVGAIRENAERLRSGKVVGKGQFIQKFFESIERGRFETEPSETSVYEESITCVFDFNHDRFSFWRNRKPVGEARRMPFSVFGYVSLPDRSILIKDVPDRSILIKDIPIPAIPSHQSVEIHDPGFPRDVGGNLFQPIFDPRVIGYGRIFNLHGQFDNLLEVYFPKKPLTAHDEGEGIWRIERHTSIDNHGNGNVKIWWCDEQQGLQPTKYLDRFHKDETHRFAALYNKRTRPSEESETSWTQIAGVWLPKTVKLWGRRGGREIELRLEFDWHRVNEAISASEFDWRNWSLPEGSRVSDHRPHGEVPVILAVVGQSEEPEESRVSDFWRFAGLDAVISGQSEEPEGSRVSDHRQPGEVPVTSAVVGQPEEVEFIPIQRAPTQPKRFFLLALSAAVVGGILGYFAMRSIRERATRSKPGNSP